MNRYMKRVEVTDTGMVIAEVYCASGARVGLKFFSPWWYTIFPTDKRLNKMLEEAHVWADAHMETCAKHEVTFK